mgnify:FL=1
MIDNTFIAVGIPSYYPSKNFPNKMVNDICFEPLD